jgi:hypothetical protein
MQEKYLKVSDWRDGVLEWWRDGMFKKRGFIFYSLLQYSITPTLQN